MEKKEKLTVVENLRKQKEEIVIAKAAKNTKKERKLYFLQMQKSLFVKDQNMKLLAWRNVQFASINNFLPVERLLVGLIVNADRRSCYHLNLQMYKEKTSAELWYSYYVIEEKKDDYSDSDSDEENNTNDKKMMIQMMVWKTEAYTWMQMVSHKLKNV